MATKVEQLLMNLIAQTSSARGMGGSTVISTGGTATGNIIAIVSCGTTYQLGACTGNNPQLTAGYTFTAPFTIEGKWSLVTAGPNATDAFIVYFG